ncbi:MAG: cell division protein ZapA [Gammaproteobacteria bacterium]|jgi:cell division protein ZapA|nr:cell division protein ZapA [Gammaproteobacteria bacterium]MBT7602979.1 cell division protein ZapA [Gammaproteobacteria bacterium]
MEGQQKKIPITVKILNQSYDVFCYEDEKDMLIQSAELLNDKMMKTKAEGKTIGLDRIAVISALNFANDSLQHKDISNSLNSTIKQRILNLNLKLNTILEN